MTALRIKTLADHGSADAAANPSKFPAGLFSICTGSYDMPNAHVEVDGVYTNKPPGGVAYRCSFRVTEAVHCIERMVDSLALKLKMDPAELRQKNFIQPEQFPYKSVLGWEYDSGNYPAALNKAMDIGYAACGASRPRSALGASYGHWHLDVHRDRGRRTVQYLRHPGHQDVRFSRDSCPPDRLGDRAHRRPDPGPGARDDLRSDRRRGIGLVRREHRGRARRHGHGSVRPGHLRQPLDADRRRRYGHGRAQDSR